MSVGRNVVANTASQLYAALIGLALVPAVVRALGVEAYGLVGFYAMAQAWFMLLDLGLTPTIGREAARFRGGAIDALQLRRLLRSMEGLFVALALAGAAILSLAAPAIAARWLKLQQLSAEEVSVALVLMAGVVALRWVAGLYRGVVAGFERIVWLSGCNAAVATARFVLVLPVMAVAGATITVYFAWQLAVAVVEVLVLARMSYRLLPPVKDASGAKARVGFEWQPLAGVMRFSLSAAFTSAMWVLVTQTDKLMLSTALALPEFAVFTLAVQVAGAITLLSAPIGQAVLPRLTRLAAAGDEGGLRRLYRDLTQVVVVAVVPIVVVLSCFAEPVIRAWTGDAAIAAQAAPVLALYAIGNGILAVAGLPYALQVARGNLDLHVLGNLFFIALFLPLLLWLVAVHGAVGAGVAWVVANALPLLLWIPLVHRRFLSGMHWRWLGADIAIPMLLAVSGGALALVAWPQPEHRWAVAAGLLLAWFGVQLLAAAGSGTTRRLLAARARRLPHARGAA
jgi:O-antigen/teichoic acid export membrane protein